METPDGVLSITGRADSTAPMSLGEAAEDSRDNFCIRSAGAQRIGK